MTSTTERPVVPWPTRREREGGPAWRALPAARAAVDRATDLSTADRPAVYVPRHAAAETVAVAEPVAAVPDVTERLPIVIPTQRSVEVRPTPPAPAAADVGNASAAEAVGSVGSPGEAVSPEERPGAGRRPSPGPRPVPAPHPARVPRPLPASAGPAPSPAPWRPTPGPRPPRPAVGSAVHDVRPGPRPLRNGLGVAAACLGAVGLPLGLVPVTGFAAAGLGVLALVFGIAGWSRVRSGTASNRGTAVTGAVLGLVALGLGVAGTVAFVRAPDRLTYDLDALTAAAPGAIVVTQPGE